MDKLLQQSCTYQQHSIWDYKKKLCHFYTKGLHAIYLINNCTKFAIEMGLSQIIVVLQNYLNGHTLP